MTVNWDGYEPHKMAYPGTAYRELTRVQAQERYDKTMADRTERCAALQRLLHNNGVDLRRDDDSIQATHDWMSAHIERDPNNHREIAPIWLAFCFDFALFLGEVLIERNPGLKWHLPASADKRYEGYHKHVVTGFTKTPAPEYCVNFDGRLEIAAFGALLGDSDRPDLLVRTLEYESDRA